MHMRSIKGIKNITRFYEKYRLGVFSIILLVVLVFNIGFLPYWLYGLGHKYIVSLTPINTLFGVVILGLIPTLITSIIFGIYFAKRYDEKLMAKYLYFLEDVASGIYSIILFLLAAIILIDMLSVPFSNAFYISIFMMGLGLTFFESYYKYYYK